MLNSKYKFIFGFFITMPRKYKNNPVLFCNVCGSFTIKAQRRAITPPARWCSGESVRIAIGRPGVHSLSRVIPKDFEKWYSQLPFLALSIKKGIMWRTSRQACLLCPRARHLTGRLHLYVADSWPIFTSPDYNFEVACPACCKRQLLGTHQ